MPRRAWIRTRGLLLLVLAIGPSAFGLDVAVTDFRLDYSGQTADTLHMDAGFGDSLLIVPQSYQLRHTLTWLLNDGNNGDGAAGASPLVAITAPGHFRLAYLLWTAPQTPSAGTVIPPTADIATRWVTMMPETTLVSAAQVIAGQENPPDTATPRLFYGGRNLTPPPGYLNFFASDSDYLAYWGTQTDSGSVRRTSQRESALGGSSNSWARYVTPASPVVCGGLGAIGAGDRPGTDAAQAVLAYETTVGPGSYGAEVRSEDLAAGTSHAVTLTRSVPPQDFAAAMDSAGNSLVLWREGNALYLAGYDSTLKSTQAPLQVQTNVNYRDTVSSHYYRPYGVTALGRGSFLLTYISPSGLVAYRVVGLPYAGKTFSMGIESAVTASGAKASFPNVCANGNRIAFTWFQNQGPGDTRVMASVWSLQGNQPNPASRLDLDAAQDSVGFGSVGAGWYPWHYFRTPSCALDTSGNLVVAYDNGFSAKAAVVRNAPIYYDSAVFTSISKRIRNGSLTFQAGLDSAMFTGYTASFDTGAVALSLAAANDSAFTTGNTGFQNFSAPWRTGKPFYRYRLVLRSTDAQHYLTPRLTALDLRLNVKPHAPRIDSLRIGSAAWQAFDSSAAYAAFQRSDSLRFILTAFDLDDEDSLRVAVQWGARVLARQSCADKIAPGTLRCVFALPPFDTTATSLSLALTAQDSSGWTSAPQIFTAALRNAPPAESLQVERHRGLDSAGAFWPARGPRDTLPLAAGVAAWIQRGDTAVLRVRIADANDSAATVSWFRNGQKLGQQSAPVGAFREYSVPLLSPRGLPDTVRVDASDPDTTVSTTVYLRANRPPQFDTLQLAAYQGTDSVWVRQGLDRITNFAVDSGLIIPLNRPAILSAAASDSDRAVGDTVQYLYTVLTDPAGCPRGTKACYAPAATQSGDSLEHTFIVPEDFLRLRATDAEGAFSEHVLALQYPFLDTAIASADQAAWQALRTGFDFVLGAAVVESTVVIHPGNQGTLLLRIDSARTRIDDHKWLDAALQWNDSGAATPTMVRFAPRTDQNPLPVRGARLLPGAALQITLRLFADSLHGDSTYVDTLSLATNDLTTPVLRIPLRLQSHDLPEVKIFTPGATGPSALLPTRSTLRFAFSEPVRGPANGSGLLVYSYRDSLIDPKHFQEIPGRWIARLNPVSALPRAAMDSTVGWADTLLFTPAYTQPALFSGLKPPDGAFMHRDILHVLISNSITDRSGNALDLRGDHQRRVPGSLDTIWTLRIDTATLRVTRVEPAAGSADWSPDSSLRVFFNAPLIARDSISAVGIDLSPVDSNRSLRVTSQLLGGQLLGLRTLGLSDGDSVLTLRTRILPAARDTLTVWLAASLADSAGATLDGNGDGYPGYVYGASDSDDAYIFTISTVDEGFYVFPNPFRFTDPRHRQKGAMTFKNFTSIRGYRAGEPVMLRIHTMEGDLVYASDRASGAPPAAPSAIDWNLRNDDGAVVGSGVYIYSLYQGNDRLIKKGKVAVVR